MDYKKTNEQKKNEKMKNYWNLQIRNLKRIQKNYTILFLNLEQ